MEIFTFNDCYTRLKVSEDKVALECFLLHARNLVDFFNTTTRVKQSKGRADDVIAEEIIGRSIDIILPGDTKDRINKQLQHISYNRLSSKQRSLFEERSVIYQLVKDGLEKYNSIASKEYQLNQLA